jgi:hypothetical protein
MVGVPRRPWEPQKLWPAGEYTLHADSHITKDRLTVSNTSPPSQAPPANTYVAIRKTSLGELYPAPTIVL